MLKYIKVYRWISILIAGGGGVISSVLVVVAITQGGDDEAIAVSLIGMFLSYPFLHYILLTTKGEAAVEQLSTKAKKTILYSNMIAFTTLILTPMLFGVFALKTWSDAGNATTWDVTTAYGETITVTTKWKDGKVKYLFDSKYDKPAFGRLSRHEIKLIDNDGFTLWSSDITGYTLKESSDGMVTGVSAEGKGEDGLDLFDYAKASSLKVEFYK
jgi:hypothetical protein